VAIVSGEQIISKIIMQADLNILKRESDVLIRILTKISSMLEKNDANDLIDYASGGSLVAIERYPNADIKEQKLYEKLVKKGTQEAKQLLIQLGKIEQDPKFQKDGHKFIYDLLKRKYKALYDLADMGE